LPDFDKTVSPHRDVRFLRDKTPTPRICMMWSVQSERQVMLFFGINPSEVTVGTGMMEFSKDVLTDWRKMADLDGYHSQSDPSPPPTRATLWDPKLKRVPPPLTKTIRTVICCATKGWLQQATRIYRVTLYLTSTRRLRTCGQCRIC
jgi:uncharacterized protein (DUF2461 family)